MSNNIIVTDYEKHVVMPCIVCGCAKPHVFVAVIEQYGVEEPERTILHMCTDCLRELGEKIKEYGENKNGL